ncbi:SDR family NAD(P)-dependent oxidoreductase [Flavobacterium nackdongense]|uniref:SDR family NAD(P)-dependent oxidoreductase n=1 Tax=Flavobacterium nackdongense TaxID=2547394 RepID=A0A4P6Y618_9FLAO|nr:SDR family NAD(P)-dependent oxidoreductase [Flavobacterium nackdongense]QBN17701.1 SDR family NAD(P)-dependent oxidoreductase [Flavobacterium nackdongense]
MNAQTKKFRISTAVVLLSLIGLTETLTAQESGYKKNDIQPIDSTYFAKDRLKGRVIVVTGGARGIGRATAIRAAREGAAVVIGDWLAAQGESTAKYIRNEGGKALFVKTDIRSTEDCNRLIAEAVKMFGKVDGALLNAGVMDGTFSGDPFDYDKQFKLLPARMDEATDEYWNNVMDINVTGTFKSMRSVAKQLLKQGKGGAIVTVGSIAGLTGLAGNPAYVASKHAVNGLTRNAAIDYAPFGIRVNSVNMAATTTPMTDKAFAYVKEVKKRGIPGMGGAKTESLLMMNDTKHRMATVWEQASVILFLLSDEASNLTGALYPTDGGWTAY